MKKKIICIVQARMKSKRLPGKVLLPLDDEGKTSIEYIYNRLKNSKYIDQIVIGTSKDESDNSIEVKCKKLKIPFYRGSLENVLSRYWEISNKLSAELIVRITGDCPLIDYRIVDEVIEHLIKSNCEYSSNALPPIHPDGLDVEVFTYEVLKKANKYSSNKDLEHVTGWITDSGKCNCSSLMSEVKYDHIRVTLDYEEDLFLIRKIIKELGSGCTSSQIIDLYNKKPNFWDNVRNFSRNEGSYMTNNEKLWQRAKKSIPSGNMILSKNPDLFIQKKWPPYFDKAKGCEIWDVSGNHFYDFSTMGVGTNILGYGNEAVDEKVKEGIMKGNLSSLNCLEELLLAEKLINITPNSHMARFARTGGEANAVAIRIARAATGKDCVAICGYHGWHDWYLSCNLNSKDSLDSHLISNLEPIGVPKKLEGLTYGFEYNNIEQLKELVAKKDIGTIKMEVERNIIPEDGFLEEVRSICDEKNIVLIFDECTSGFRNTLGPLQKKYSIYGDITIYGKALGNGYAITAIVGDKSIMKASENSFISSTFWSERIGYLAALATLKEMERLESWKKITSIGKSVKNFWEKCSLEYNLPLEIYGLDALASFSFKNDPKNYKKTFMINKLLQKGILGCDSFFASIAHEKHIHIYYEAMNEVFSEMRELSNNEKLENEVKDLVPSRKRFSRLN